MPLPAEPGAAIVEEELPPGPPPPPEPPPRALWPWLLALLILVLAGLAALFFATRDNGKKTTTAATRTVPRVVGFGKAAAVTRLEQFGFTVQIRPVPSAKPKDQVLAQAPQAGAKLSRGGAVALTVSSGPPRSGVPNVVGLEFPAAVERLRAAHLAARRKDVFAR